MWCICYWRVNQPSRPTVSIILVAWYTILRKPCSTVNRSNFSYMYAMSCTHANESLCMSFAGYTAVLCTTAGRFSCCWLAHNAVHSPTKMTIVDTSTVLNLEEENMKNSAHHTCTMVPILSDTCIPLLF